MAFMAKIHWCGFFGNMAPCKVYSKYSLMALNIGAQQPKQPGKIHKREGKLSFG